VAQDIAAGGQQSDNLRESVSGAGQDSWIRVTIVPEARLEILVEPFKMNDPGPHVMAVVTAARAAGLDVDMGPFATTATGDLATILDTSSTMLRTGFDAGATSIQIRMELT